MQTTVLLLIGVLAAGGSAEYARSFDAKTLDQASFDAESFGDKKALKREDGGLRVELAAGLAETGWKTPPQLRFGGDFTVSAGFVMKKLPKPALEDGVAIGLAISYGDINQPDVTLVRLLEPPGTDVYRSIEKAAGNDPNQMQMQMMMNRRGMMMGGMPPGGKPPKPPRRTSPAAGDSFRLEIEREGSTIRFQVTDARSPLPRYLGQVTTAPQDVAALKLFVTNRNGAEAVNVLLVDLTIRADRINGLGTTVRTVYDKVVYGDPTAIEGNLLVIGGTPKQPPPDPAATPPAQGAAPAAGQAPAGTPTPGDVKPATPDQGKQPVAAATAKFTTVVVATADPAKAATAAAEPAKKKDSPSAEAKPGGMPDDVFAKVPGQPGAPAKPPEQKPKAKLSLDEVDSIRFERAPMMAARFMGQPNLDFTKPGLSAKSDEKKEGEAKKDEKPKADEKKPAEAKKDEKKKDEKPKAEAKKDEKKTDGSDDVLAPPPGTAAVEKIPKVEPEKNGIRDIYLTLSGLRPSKIKQVTVNCQTDGGPTAWRLDTSNSKDWPLVVRRSGTEMSADLFLEPPSKDCHQKDFTIAVTYEDGQMGNATTKAAEHSDAKLAVDPKTPATPKLDVWLYLTGDEKLFGKLEGLGTDSVKLTTPWQDKLDVPLARVVGLHLGQLERKESPESFAKRLKEQGAEDVLLAQTKKGEVITIPGILEGLEGEKLRFRFQNKSRTLPLNLVEGLILATRPAAKRPDDLRASFALAGGLAISGRWKDMDTKTWKVETPWGQPLNLPAADVQSVRFLGGRMTYLSDLKPGKVEELPYFGHRLPWRPNLGLLGEPLKVSGKTFERGVAVHSRCFLTYDLGGRYSTFEATLGFDDAAKGKGRVDCRVVADGKELYANPDLRADGPPVKLKLPVEKVQQLRLLVDFGKGQDTGDRVVWANARLYRESTPKVADGGR